jgi:hypothetical protein
MFGQDALDYSIIAHAGDPIRAARYRPFGSLLDRPTVNVLPAPSSPSRSVRERAGALVFGLRRRESARLVAPIPCC